MTLSTALSRLRTFAFRVGDILHGDFLRAVLEWYVVFESITVLDANVRDCWSPNPAKTEQLTTQAHRSILNWL